MEKVIFDFLKDSSLNAFILTAGFIILKSWLQLNRREIDALSKTIKENSHELRALSNSIVKLEINIESVLNLETRVDRAEDCIDRLFKKVK